MRWRVGTRKKALLEAERLGDEALRLCNVNAFSAALPLAEQSAAVYLQVVGANNLLTAHALDLLSEINLALGAYTPAVECATASLTTWEAHYGPSHRFVATSLAKLATIHQKRGSFYTMAAITLAAPSG